METFGGKRVLVTGAGGFIGAHLSARLISEGATVYALVRPGGDVARLRALAPEAIIKEIDITDSEAVRLMLEEIKPEGVFHLAAASQTYGRVPTLEQLVDTNVRATLSLMDEMQQYPFAFFVNTDSSVMVGPKDRPQKETDVLEPTELYGVSRVAGTHYASALGRTKGRPMVTVRVFTPYGPYHQAGKLHYNIVVNALKGKELPLSAPAVNRDLIYIDDLVEIYIAAAQHAKEYPGEVFNGGTGTSTTLEDFEAAIRARIPEAGKAVWSNTVSTYDLAYWCADVSKVKKAFNWEPKTSLAEGLDRTVAWFRENEDYWNEA